MALGSDAGSIFSLVVREGLMLVAIGLGAGFIGAFAIRRAMEAQLFGIGPMDPLVLSVVVVTLSIVALLACAIPARRAARIDPLVALADQ
jgi:putative ABC transport system permease protein